MNNQNQKCDFALKYFYDNVPHRYILAPLLEVTKNNNTSFESLRNYFCHAKHKEPCIKTILNAIKEQKPNKIRADKYNGNTPWHTAYEIEYSINGIQDCIKDVDDYKELQTYILQTKPLSLSYHNEYINSKMQDLLRFFESIMNYELIMFKENIQHDIWAILKFIRNNHSDTYTIVNQFIFGYPDLCTTGQIHNAILSYSGCGYDGFIPNLENAYQESLFKAFEKIIAFYYKLKNKSIVTISVLMSILINVISKIKIKLPLNNKRT